MMSFPPAQMNNLEHELECKVMWTELLLILDIFAKHATTSEGKIQVELAQLRYRASRLVGLGASLSRLGGGIGTRGPGEKKLESDRRLIRKRITALKEELSLAEKHRELLRTGRTRGKMKTAAIVGYTNAGKSTLLNTPSYRGWGAFRGQAVCNPGPDYKSSDTGRRTADPSYRYCWIYPQASPQSGGGAEITLEEANMQTTLSMQDCSNPQAVQQMEVVYDTLHELEVQGKKNHYAV